MEPNESREAATADSNLAPQAEVLRPTVGRWLLRTLPGVALAAGVGGFALAAGWVWGALLVGLAALFLAFQVLNLWRLRLILAPDALGVRSWTGMDRVPWDQIARFELDDPRAPSEVVIVFQPRTSRPRGQMRLPSIWPGHEESLAQQLEEMRRQHTG